MDLFQYQYVLFIACCALSAVAFFYAFLYPQLAEKEQVQQRRLQFERSSVAKSVNERLVDQNKRRQQIVESLKEIEGTTKRKVSLENRIAQAGLQMTNETYYIVSLSIGAVAALLAYLFKGSIPIAAVVGVCAGFFAPRFFLKIVFDRRMKQFLEEFPVAVEVIVRGVKAGLPIGQCMGVVANEAKEPVRSEFKKVIEAQVLGLSVPEALEKMPERIPLSEVKFFSIVITLQSKSGGNLAEALNNLSNVLRERKIMKQKILAMSSEVRMTSYIVCAMPFLIAFGIYTTSPDYMKLLFTHPTGQTMLGVSAIMMGFGMFVFKKMSNFDY